MKLVVAIVHNCDRNAVTEQLVNAGFKFTIIGSTGGFLREGNTTFLCGVEPHEIEVIMSVFRDNCSSREQIVTVSPMDGAGGAFLGAPIKVPVGGAVVFVLPVEGFERF